jgi:hypothetical protein
VETIKEELTLSEADVEEPAASCIRLIIREQLIRGGYIAPSAAIRRHSAPAHHGLQPRFSQVTHRSFCSQAHDTVSRFAGGSFICNVLNVFITLQLFIGLNNYLCGAQIAQR